MPIPTTTSTTSTRRRRAVALTAALTLVLALGACGDDDVDDADAAPPATDEAAESTAASDAASTTAADEGAPAVDDYLAEVNAICTAGNQQLDALAAEGFADDAEPTEEQLVAVLDQIVDVIVAQLDDIEALEPPADLAPAVDAWLADARTTADDVRASGPAFFDQQANGENPFADVNATAIEIGFDACGT